MKDYSSIIEKLNECVELIEEFDNQQNKELSDMGKEVMIKINLQRKIERLVANDK